MKTLKLFLVLSLVAGIINEPLVSAVRKQQFIHSCGSVNEEARGFHFKGTSESDWLEAEPRGSSLMLPEEGRHLPFEGSAEKGRICRHSSPRVFMVSLGEGYDPSRAFEQPVAPQGGFVPCFAADRAARRVADGSGDIEGAASLVSPASLSVFPAKIPEEQAYCRSLRADTGGYSASDDDDDDDEDVDTAARPAAVCISTRRHRFAMGQSRSAVLAARRGALAQPLNAVLFRQQVSQKEADPVAEAGALIPFGVTDEAYAAELARAQLRATMEQWNEANLE
ncbi:hypothetical protein FJ365_01205 [Candidatus Dependentiae bacterium]|nr:hypothetical protein [Candidatus Dependentiae bacterium]